MKTPDSASPPALRVGRYALALVAAWTVVVAGLLVWALLEERNASLESARIQARQAFEKDLVYRRWAAGHGGVYVPVTEETPPNPYLSHVENRDVTTTSGLKLTLVNPAYMTRQVHELGLEQYGLRGHITSLNPIRPENAPDPWEAAALQAFERGETEVTALESIEGEEHLRLMRPLFVEQRCLKCHAAQGYKVGDIRGGISVSLPVAPLSAIARDHATTLALGHLFLWLLGLGGIGLGGRRIAARVRERDRAEEAMRESEELHRITLSNISDAVFITDDAGTFTYICPNVDVIFGYSQQEVRQLGNISKLLDNGFQESAGVGEAREIQNIEHRISDKSGRTHVLLTNVKRVLIKAGTVLYTCRDITERKRAEEVTRETQARLLEQQQREHEHVGAELEKLRAELVRQTRLATIGQVSASIGHELRNPLGTVRNAVYLLKGRVPEDDPKWAEYLGMIDQEVNRANRTIGNLMEMSRPKEPYKQEVDLARVVQQACAEANLPAGVRWRMSFDPDPFLVNADSGQLRQVLSNLLINAVQAMDGRGQITLAATRAGDYDSIIVEDDGPGIALEQREHVFDPLFSTKARGTGLGLAICRQIIERHGGSIELVKGKGSGAAFLIRLPRLVQHEVLRSRSSHAGRDRGANKNVGSDC